MVTYILPTTARKMERARINAAQQAVGKVARSVRKLVPTTGPQRTLRVAARCNKSEPQQLRPIEVACATAHNYTIIILSHTIDAFKDSFAPPPQYTTMSQILEAKPAAGRDQQTMTRAATWLGGRSHNVMTDFCTKAQYPAPAATAHTRNCATTHNGAA